MTDTPTYAPPPPGSPRMDDDPGDRDPYLDPQAEALRQQREREDFARDVRREVRTMRAREAARAQIAAENTARHDYTDHYLSRSQLLDLPAPDPLIDRVLPRHAYGILRGRDHSLKSFTAVDWACCLATGKPWQGHATVQVPVLYIAGEGAHGLAARIEAWEYAWGRLVPDTHLTIRKTALDLPAPGPAFDHLLEHITSRGYGLIVVDTLRRVSGAADGNSSEMGRVIDNLDRIKQATHDGTVLAVAHTDKGDHDTRGYSG
ncbi:MAG: AAA family ATPase, partial [Actinomycetota bacterium]|nr:AAA family ATPase [Actinomycetota bacterium]